MQITQLVNGQPAMTKELAQLIQKVTLPELKSRLEEKVYGMLVKIKKQNTQITESAINRDDFLEVIKSVDGQGLSQGTQ